MPPLNESSAAPAAPATLPMPGVPGAGAAGPPAVPSRVVRAVLAATRLAPGDRALVAGPHAEPVAAVLEHLGLRVAASAEAVGAAAAFEAAVWCGPAAAGDDGDLADLAPLVRPGRQAVALRRCEDLTAVDGPGVRFADRGRFGFPAGRGGWAMRTAPGRAAADARPAPAPLLAAA